MKKIIPVALIAMYLMGCTSSDTEDLNITKPSIEDDIKDDIDDLIPDFDMDIEDDMDNMTYQDGVYRAEYTEYIDGYKDYVEITVKNGIIEKVEHDGLNDKGEKKSIDEDLKNKYFDEYQTYPEEYMRKYSSSLVDNQSLDMIDVYNGTQKEHGHFNTLAQKALDSSRIGNSETSMIDKVY